MIHRKKPEVLWDLGVRKSAENLPIFGQIWLNFGSFSDCTVALGLSTVNLNRKSDLNLF